MKTLTICLFAAAIVAVGAGGFIQIQSLQERVGMLESAFVQQIAKAEASATEKDTRTEAAAKTPSVEVTPAPPHRTAAKQSESTTPAEISYLDQLLDL